MVRFSEPSDSDNNRPPKGKLFGRQRPLRDVLGGRKVADVILWRNKNASAGILIGGTLIWSLFEVMEYPFLTLICHISIVAMLVVFLWSNGAAFLERDPPKIPEIILSQEAFKETALTFHAELTWLISVLHDIASGKDIKLFVMACGSLWILSVIGSWCSSLSLLYFGFLCALTLPVLYEHFEEEVDSLAYKAIREIKRSFKKFDSSVLDKIPRGPGKEHKYK